MARIAVLASGGLDSAVLLADLGQENTVFPVYVEAGLAWEGRERRALEAYLAALDLPRVQPLTVLEMPVRSFYGNHWSTTGQDVPGYHAPDSAVYLPGRNVLLIGVTAVWCALNDVDGIAIGSLDDNPFPDATPAFFEDYGRLLSDALDHQLQVIAPYRSRHKSQIIASFPELPLELTLTCMKPVLDTEDAPEPTVLGLKDTPKPPVKGRMTSGAIDGGQESERGKLVHCGDCNKCRERREAFAEARVADRTRYAKDAG